MVAFQNIKKWNHFQHAKHYSDKVVYNYSKKKVEVYKSVKQLSFSLICIFSLHYNRIQRYTLKKERKIIN